MNKKYFPPMYVILILIIWSLSTLGSWLMGMFIVEAMLLQVVVISIGITILFFMFKLFSLLDKYEEWRNKE